MREKNDSCSVIRAKTSVGSNSMSKWITSSRGRFIFIISHIKLETLFRIMLHCISDAFLSKATVYLTGHFNS